MEVYWRVLLLCIILVTSMTPVSAAAEPGLIERLLLATHQRPWLWGIYVFSVGLPIILFISFMWPDKRFGPPDQPYYYKKTDEDQPDDPEVSGQTRSVTNKGKSDGSVTRRREPRGLQRKSDLDQK
ncbi:calnexin-like [Cheilinus undulatus]|uniref:calnexin-like n=1 Tax=Cheilinus undulatus TaxID=241271 RepID=UPI001BD2E673|nr:calnexin-like [Cheilinus undulatus]